jgi:DNA-binding NarL/FixJ family response regulator
MKLRALVVDDHQVVRAGLCLLLKEIGDIEIVGEACDGKVAVQLARQLHPDFILMDVSLPGLNGLDATRRIRQETPAAKVIILTMHATEAMVLDAIRAGASAYLTKEAAPEELKMAIDASRADRTFLSPSISKFVVNDYLRVSRGESLESSGTGINKLTLRQREVLQLLAEGKRTRDIAGRLSLSAKTIETHRAEIMRKLAVTSVAELVRLAMRAGIVPIEAQLADQT